MRLISARVPGLLVAAAGAAIVSFACGGGTPAAPSPVPSTPSSPNLTGITSDGLNDAPLAGISIRINGVAEATSDASGRFEMTLPDPQQPRAVVVSSPLVITRETRLLAPGPHVALWLMPASMDLTAFDQMFRHTDACLHRWMSAPSLIVCDRVLRFTSVSDAEYVATDIVLSDADVESIQQDASWGLPQASGNTLSAFAGTSRYSPPPGEPVAVRRSGAIFIARYEGLQDATSYWGYGRWAFSSSGAVTAGIVMLDAAFDRSGSMYTRSLRVHELGHSLGWGHVTARTSFMNSNGRILPTPFDTAAARLAFRRPPLNRSPDIDPALMTANRETGDVRWSGLP